MQQETAKNPSNKPAAAGVGPNSSGLLRRWMGLLLCMLVVWAFMFVFAPMLQRVPAINALTSYIEDSGINASALYYTGLDETAEAEMYLHESEKHAPRKP
jgi:hypothetical protein